MQILKTGFLYFALVFAAGFVLGILRELWAVPGFGQMTAELMEMPVMLVVIVFAARWTVRRLETPPAPLARLGIGLVALGALIFMELTVVLAMRGLTLRDYIETRDPVSGTVYLVMLGVFAIMPLLVVRR